MTEPIGYAFALGLVALLNPCGFPLLPAFLTAFLRPGSDSFSSRIRRALAAGVWMTVGFVCVFGAAAVIAAAGAAVVAPWVAEFMILIGLVLITVGVLEVLGKTVRLPLPIVRFAEGRGPLSMLGFGATYAVGSLSCSLPIFLAGVAGAFARHDSATGIFTFGAYALGMGVFITTASVLVAVAGAGSLRRMARLTRYFPIFAGCIGIIVGGYLVVYWVSVWLDPAVAAAMSTAIDTGLSGIQGMIDGNFRAVGAVMGGAVVVFVAVAAVLTRHTREQPKKGSVNAHE
ncbi:MAG: cytochrome c biogenesis CcdA family protein [Lacisediminihabitans sp.]